MVSKAPLLEKLIGATLDDFTDGPHRKSLLEGREHHPEFSDVINRISDLGDHMMLLSRGCQNLGLVSNLDTVEPGYKVTGLAAGEELTNGREL